LLGNRQRVDSGAPGVFLTSGIPRILHLHGGSAFAIDDGVMAQRSVEIVIGRLLTDEAFRAAFFGDPATTLSRFVESGYDLTALELTALRTTRSEVWAQWAEQIDPRLQKVCL